MAMLERVFGDRMSFLTDDDQMRQETMDLATSSLAVEFLFLTPSSLGVTWNSLSKSPSTLPTDLKTCKKEFRSYSSSNLFNTLVQREERIIGSNNTFEQFPRVYLYIIN